MKRLYRLASRLEERGEFYVEMRALRGENCVWMLVRSGVGKRLRVETNDPVGFINGFADALFKRPSVSLGRAYLRGYQLGLKRYNLRPLRRIPHLSLSGGGKLGGLAFNLRRQR